MENTDDRFGVNPTIVKKEETDSTEITDEQVTSELTSHTQFNKLKYEASTDTASLKILLYEQPSVEPLKIETPDDFKTIEHDDTAAHNRKKSRAESFICSICGHGFTSRFDIKIEEVEFTETSISGATSTLEHLQSPKTKTTKKIVNGNKTYMCNICDFTKKSGFVEAQKQNGEKIFKCPACSYSSTTHKVLVKHFRTHRAAKRYKCTLCEYSGRYPRDLTFHTRKHTGERPFKCTLCDFACAQPSSLKRHLMQHTSPSSRTQRARTRTEKKFNCTLCDYSCTIRSSLKEHMRTHPKAQLFKCTVCDYSTTVLRHLQIHTRTHTELKPFQCPVCNYASAYRRVLKAHMRTHTGEKPHKCTLCDYASNHRVNLKYHITTHTGEKPFKCDVCDYASAKGSLLRDHMRKHTGEKRFHCTICDYGSPFHYGLTQHMTKHTGEKSFLCDMCGHATATRSQLNCHMAMHTTEKKVLCSVCGCAVRKHRLKRHMQTHTGERPFQCTLCNYASVTQYHLKRHMRTHTKETPSKNTILSSRSMSKARESRPSSISSVEDLKTITMDEEDGIPVQKMLKKSKFIVMSPIIKPTLNQSDGVRDELPKAKEMTKKCNDMSPILNITKDDIGDIDYINEGNIGDIDYISEVDGGNQMEEEVTMVEIRQTMNQSDGVGDEVRKVTEVTKKCNDVAAVLNISKVDIGDIDDINDIDYMSKIDGENQMEEEVTMVGMRQTINQSDRVGDEISTTKEEANKYKVELIQDVRNISDALAAIAALRKEFGEREKLWMEEKMNLEDRISKLENRRTNK